MKRKIGLGLGASALALALMLGNSGGNSTKVEAQDAAQNVNLNLNGVNITNASTVLQGKVVYASVDVFARHYKVSWSLDKKGVLKLGGKIVTTEYGKAQKNKSGVLIAPVQAMAETLGDANKKKEGHYETGYDKATKTQNVAILPKGVVTLENHFVVPKMGSHWADPAKLPLGPIWGTYKGKLVFFEYMPDKELNKDVTLDGTQNVPIPTKIDHTDINWNPKGHPGDLNPHYDIHMYFITKAEQDKIK